MSEGFPGQKAQDAQAGDRSDDDRHRRRFGQGRKARFDADLRAAADDFAKEFIALAAAFFAHAYCSPSRPIA
ncbi:hypothetical protein SAMN02799626_01234 [Caulobacter sp. UNC279MFTsu5.1]|nr:hypothetical protein SAMN02799626_01234 [Caulobacter sp. UNC279MFTsu5.1]